MPQARAGSSAAQTTMGLARPALDPFELYPLRLHTSPNAHTSALGPTDSGDRGLDLPAAQQLFCARASASISHGNSPGQFRPR